MKLICVQDHWPASNGVMGIGAKPRRRIAGLTEGKTYFGNVVGEASGQYTTTDFYIIVFDDNRQWTKHKMFLFEPADDQG